MKRKLFNYTKITLIGLILNLPLGCVQKEYDLSKDMDLNVSVGGKAFSLPLGTTEDITMVSMIDTAKSDVIHIIDGQFYISKSDSMEVVMDKVDPVYVNQITPTINPSDLSFESPVPDSEGGYTYTSTITVDPAEASVDNEVPNDVVAVTKSMLITPDYLQLKLSPKSFPPTISEITLKQFKIKFPDFYVFNDNQINSNNELILNGKFSVSSDIVINIKFIGFKFATNPIVKSGGVTKIITKEDVLMGGTATIHLPTDTDPSISARLEYSMVSPKVQMGLFNGIVDPVIEDAKHVINLSDLPDFVTGEGTVLDLKNPVIIMDIKNAAGVPIKSLLAAYPLNKNNEKTADSLQTPFPIYKAEPLGIPKETNLWISDTPDYTPPGYEYIEEARLPLLIRNVPNQIDLLVKSKSDQSIPHELDLNEKYIMDVNYNVQFPFKPGKDLIIHYVTSFDGLNKDLKDIIGKTKEVIAKAVVRNAIPLDMNIELTPVDINGKTLANVTVSAPGIVKAGKGIDNIVTTEYQATVTTTVPGALEKLDGFKLKLNGSSNLDVEGIIIDDKQFVKAKVDFLVPGGLSFDLNK